MSVPGSPPAGVVDPCTLLAAADLSSLGGVTGNPQRESDTDWGPQCDYPIPVGLVQVVAIRPAVSDAAFEYASTKVDIPGLGDRAYYDTDWARIRVRDGSNRFQVSCLCSLPAGTDQQVLTGLAHAIVGHL